MSVRLQIVRGSPAFVPRMKVAAAAALLFLTLSLFAESTPTSPYFENAFPPLNESNSFNAKPPTGPSPSISSLQEIANNTALHPVAPPATRALTNVLTPVIPTIPGTSGSKHLAPSLDQLNEYKQRLETARYLRVTRQASDAEPLFIQLIAEDPPEMIQQSALLELAATVQDENDLPRAQQIYAQFLNKWPTDLRIPEVLLRQGLLYRQMGFNNLALTKFYAVMTSALVLKNDQLDYYARLVIQSQLEIAQTHYQLGKYTDAADFFARLLKQTNSMDRAEILYKLTRCHTALARYGEAVADAQDFLERFPHSPQQPEVRFHLAVSLKELGRDNESLQQVLLLLEEQRTLTQDRPEVWAYWQQRAGNLIANHLYREGDYDKALDIYLNLVHLDHSPTWQIPVKYQIGITYERLWQPQAATEIYTDILSHEKELGTNATPSLKAVFDMARWRINFMKWQNNAEAANRQFYLPARTNPAVTASLPPAAAIP
jgi:tetratricopeptide (TPR) repeat protein